MLEEGVTRLSRLLNILSFFSFSSENPSLIKTTETEKFLAPKIKYFMARFNTCHSKINFDIKKYEYSQSKRIGQFMTRCLRVGKIKLSDLIETEVDFLKTSLDQIYSSYSFSERYLFVYTTYISIHDDSVSPDEQEKKIFLSEIEQIYYLERPGSTFFLIKLQEHLSKNIFKLQARQADLSQIPETSYTVQA